MTVFIKAQDQTIQKITGESGLPSIYLLAHPDGYARVDFINCQPADYMIDGNSTARPLYTSDEIDRRATAQFEQWKREQK